MQDKKQRQQAKVHEVHMDEVERLGKVKRLCSSRSGTIRSAVTLYMRSSGALEDGKRYQFLSCDIQYNQAENQFSVSIVPWKDRQNLVRVAYGYTIDATTGACKAINDGHSPTVPTEEKGFLGWKMEGAVILPPEASDETWQEGQFSPTGMKYQQFLNEMDSLLEAVVKGKNVTDEFLQAPGPSR